MPEDLGQTDAASECRFLWLLEMGFWAGDLLWLWNPPHNVKAESVLFGRTSARLDPECAPTPPRLALPKRARQSIRRATSTWDDAFSRSGRSEPPLRFSNASRTARATPSRSTGSHWRMSAPVTGLPTMPRHIAFGLGTASVASTIWVSASANGAEVFTSATKPVRVCDRCPGGARRRISQASGQRGQEGIHLHPRKLVEFWTPPYGSHKESAGAQGIRGRPAKRQGDREKGRCRSTKTLRRKRHLEGPTPAHRGLHIGN